ncbi:hypothetical protein RJ641_011849 [Dillenia turbinata]|uniref:Uncharacterized protein n=1 Tax=Dillenia turbinata TaxID=194707 RepID=A0AAN8UX17_9MAGN
MDRLNIPLGSLVLTLLCGIHSRLALGITSSSGWNSSQNPTTSPTSLPPTLSCTSIEIECYLWEKRDAGPAFNKAFLVISFGLAVPSDGNGITNVMSVFSEILSMSSESTRLGVFRRVWRKERGREGFSVVGLDGSVQFERQLIDKLAGAFREFQDDKAVQAEREGILSGNAVRSFLSGLLSPFSEKKDNPSFRPIKLQ